LDHDGGDEAVDGVPDSHTLATQFTIDRSTQFKSRTVVLQINQSFKLAFGGDVFRLGANAL
jgi:hypothetical protein